MATELTQLRARQGSELVRQISSLPFPFHTPTSFHSVVEKQMTDGWDSREINH